MVPLLRRLGTCVKQLFKSYFGNKVRMRILPPEILLLGAFSGNFSQPSCSCCLLNWVWLFATPWTVACQASLSFTIFQSLLKLMSYWGFPGGASGKESACQCRRHKRHRFNPWVGKIPWRRVWQPTSIFLFGEFNGKRSLVGYSPWGCKESDTNEAT